VSTCSLSLTVNLLAGKARFRYRNSARSSNTPDSSMGNAGFRTVSL